MSEQMYSEIRSVNELVAWLRTKYTSANALAVTNALEIGDGLLRGLALGETMGGLCRACNIPPSTARLYRRLAEHRTEIEVALAERPGLSLREARALIAENSTRERSSARKRFDALAWWKGATNDERQQLLAAIGLVGLLGALPSDLRKEIESRVAGLHNRSGDSGDVNTTLTKVFRTAMSHMAAAAAAQSPVVAQSQEIAALAALRAVARLHGDFHTLTVGIQATEKTRQRRAA
jgi:hypothetical protein